MSTPPPSFDPAIERALRAIGVWLAAAEAQVPKTAPAPPGRWRWLTEIPKWAPVVTPIIVAVLGALLAYALTGYFQQTLDIRKLELELQKFALEQRKADLSGIGQMRELIADLYQEGITPADAEAIALSLAAFGDLAAAPLIHAVETGSPNRRTGAETGLAAAALAAPDRVCATLAQVIDNRTALFNWQTHESALRLLGQLGCRNQRLSVEAFGRLLGGGVAGYRPTVHENGVPEVNDVIVHRLLDEQRRALERLAAAQGQKATIDLARTAFSLILTLQLPGAAAAALIECPRISATPGSKVVVDEVRPSDGGAAALSALEERRLQNAIHQQIGQLNAERPAEVQAVVCRQRWPEGPDEFSPALSRNLLAHDVLIELWGEREEDLALIQYAVLPIRLRAGSNLPGIYSSAYRFDTAGGIDTLFRDARELQAFTALALGFQALEQAQAASTVSDADKIARSARFNDARSYFCEAERLLIEAEARADEFGPDSQQWKALIALASDRATETARTARADPAYVGALKLLPNSLLDSCQPGVS